MADYRKIVFIIRNKNKGYSWSMGSKETNCDLGNSDNKMFGIQKNNTSYGMTWDDFKNYSKELLYEPNCENFKNMPKDIYALIFKKFRWDKIKGDKIKNQGIANILSEFYGFRLSEVFNALNKFGYVRPYKSGTIEENINNALMLTDDDVNFINKLDEQGKSGLLFDELKKEKDIVYWSSKPYVLRNSEKIALGVGALFLIYAVYKLIKK